jgi:hypothetical protein
MGAFCAPVSATMAGWAGRGTPQPAHGPGRLPRGGELRVGGDQDAAAANVGAGAGLGPGAAGRQRANLVDDEPATVTRYGPMSDRY